MEDRLLTWADSGRVPRSWQRQKLIGSGCLLVTALGWGLNWPATKALLAVCPPLTARGIAGIVASIALASLAARRGETLSVPAGKRMWLIQAALLNVTAWMGLTTLSLLWLNAGEAATLAYTMPIWASVLAWPVLHERLTLRRICALVLGIGGVALQVGAGGLQISRAHIPGIVIALAAALLFALGTVTAKKRPLELSPLVATAWQVGIGCVPLLLVSFLLEKPKLDEMGWFGWAALSYTAAISLGVCYLAWFAALRRLDASTAAIGTLLTPIVGVTASTISLNEPLQATGILSLFLVVVGIALAIR